MRKIIALLLCCMMMAGALCAFAEGTVEPRIDCNHDNYGTYERLSQSGVKVGTCRYKDVYKVYCAECDRVIDSYNVFYTEHEGPIQDENGVDVCQACHKKHNLLSVPHGMDPMPCGFSEPSNFGRLTKTYCQRISHKA